MIWKGLKNQETETIPSGCFLKCEQFLIYELMFTPGL